MSAGPGRRVVVAGALAAVLAVAGAGPAAAGSRAADCVPDAGYTSCRAFDYASGVGETFVVPEGVTRVHALAWGAGGGAADTAGQGIAGGGGGYAEGDIEVRAYDVLTLTVGGGGQRGDVGGGGSGGVGAGSGGHGGGTSAATRTRGGGGGGGSAIERGSQSLLVAGGGGGSSVRASGVGGGSTTRPGAQWGAPGQGGYGGPGGTSAGGVYNGVAGSSRDGGAGGATAARAPGTARVTYGYGGGGGGGGYGGGGGGGSTHAATYPDGGGGGGGNQAPAGGSSLAAQGQMPGNVGHRLRAGTVGVGAVSGDATAGHGRIVLQWGASSPEPGPGGLVAVQGDGQSAEAGAHFGMELVARVQDAQRTGLPDVPVTFTIEGATGSRFAASEDPAVRVAADGTSVTVTSVDDPGSAAATGRATTPRVVAGPAPGDLAVRAVADGVTDQVRFSLHVTPGEATGVSIESGDGQRAAPGTSFAQNVRVAVRNSAGAPVQGVPVTFTIQGPTGTTFAGGGTTSSGNSDVDGLAGSTRIDAGFSGTAQIVAEIPGGARVVFELLVTGSTTTGVNPFTGEVR